MLSYQFSFSQVQYIGDFLPLFLTQDKYLKPVSGEQIKKSYEYLLSFISYYKEEVYVSLIQRSELLVKLYNLDKNKYFTMTRHILLKYSD